jgi:hypothetical protein
MKQTPKSCSCEACKRGKHTVRGHKLMRYEERAYRHHVKIMLAKGSEPTTAAPRGGYYD